MTRISLNTDEVISLKARLSKLSNQIFDLEKDIMRSLESLDWEAGQKTEINNQINSYRRKASKLAADFSQLSIIIGRVINDFTQTDHRITSSQKEATGLLEKVWKGFISLTSKTLSKINQIGMQIIGAFFRAGQIFLNQHNEIKNADLKLINNSLKVTDNAVKPRIITNDKHKKRIQLLTEPVKKDNKEKSTKTKENNSRNIKIIKMTVSESLISFLASYEGFSSKPYRGQDKKNLTIGYGHVIKPGENFSKGISRDQALKLLEKDINQHYAATVNKWAKKHDIKLTQNQFDALVSFTYNIGSTGFLESSVAKDILNGVSNPNKLKEDFLKWDKVRDPETGKLIKSTGLWRRRLDEWEIFVTGDYKRDNPKPHAN